MTSFLLELLQVANGKAWEMTSSFSVRRLGLSTRALQGPIGTANAFFSFTLRN